MKRLILCLALCAGASFAQGVNYTYDNAGRLTRVDYDNGTSIVYVYDPAGNLLSRTVTTGHPTPAAKRARTRNVEKKSRK
jgi:YD repeat-containing protein